MWDLQKSDLFFVNMCPQVFLLTSGSLRSILDLDSPSCRACCNYERELWARMDQLDLFKIRIYLKGIPNHKLILFFFPSALNNIPRHISWKRGDPSSFFFFFKVDSFCQAAYEPASHFAHFDPACETTEVPVWGCEPPGFYSFERTFDP